MVEVTALSPNPSVAIHVKLEGVNPAGSVKDRVARQMILEAEADGTLEPGRTIIEPSSGNTGIALAMIARLRGYPIKIVMPENVSAERRQLLEVFGAEIIWSPGAEGSNGAVRMAQKLADDNPEWAFLYQYGNEANPRAHYYTTGPEIYADCPEITHFVSGLGTSGTLMGVGAYLKERKPSVQVLAVEPPAGEMVDGLRSLDDGFIPPVYEKWGGDPAPRRQAHRATPGVDRVDSAPVRGGGNLRRHLHRRGAGRGCPGGRAGRQGNGGGGVGRRRLEVPVHRGVDRPDRPGDGPSRVDHLLLNLDSYK